MPELSNKDLLMGKSKYKITVQAALQAAKLLSEPHQNQNALEREGWAANRQLSLSYRLSKSHGIFYCL